MALYVQCGTRICILYVSKNRRVMEREPVQGAASDYSRSAFVRVVVWMTYRLWTQTWAYGNTKTRLNVGSRPDMHLGALSCCTTPPLLMITVQNTLDYLCWRGLDHLPYSPGLSPLDFHVFDPLKKAPMGRILQPEECEVEAKKVLIYLCLFPFPI